MNTTNEKCFKIYCLQLLLCMDVQLPSFIIWLSTIPLPVKRHRTDHFITNHKLSTEQFITDLLLL